MKRICEYDVKNGGGEVRNWRGQAVVLRLGINRRVVFLDGQFDTKEI